MKDAFDIPEPSEEDMVNYYSGNADVATVTYLGEFAIVTNDPEDAGSNNGIYKETLHMHYFVKYGGVYLFKEITSSWEGTTSYDERKVREGSTVMVTFDNGPFLFDVDYYIEGGRIEISVDEFINNYCELIATI